MLTSDLARHWKLLAWIWDQDILYIIGWIIHRMVNHNHEMYDHEMSDHEIYDIMKLSDHEMSDH